MPPTKPEVRAQPQQSRSQETFAGILEAASDLFAQNGYEQTTTHQIAGAAGVSVGALYRYFDSKQAILRELYDREISGLRQKAFEEFSIADLVSKDLPQLVRKTLALAFRIYGERPGLRRVLVEQSRKIPELVELRSSMEAQVHGAVRQILAAAPGMTLDDVEVAAYLITVFIESVMDDFVLYRGREGVSFPDERVIEAASEFVIRCVMGRVDSTAT
jgi:AcrR family transcriptional regulator